MSLLFNLQPFRFLLFYHFICHHLESLLYPKESPFYPLPLALKLKGVSKKESAVRRFFPWLEVPVLVQNESKKGGKKSSSGRGIFQSTATMKKTVHMPLLRKLAANPHTNFTKDWVTALGSVTNSGNANKMLLNCKYDEAARKYLNVKVRVVVQLQ